MDSGLKTISSLFDGAKKFIIPTYQRAYSWDYSEWMDFWEDIYYHSSDQKYFFGTILLKESKRKGDFELIEIVDGQQRITTITIFIFELLYRLKQTDPNRKLKIKEDKYLQYEDNYKLIISRYDNEFFQTYILNNSSKNLIFRTPSQRKLYEAKKHFFDQLEDKTKIELEKMLEMLEQSEILVYSVKDSAEATLIFETTNDRGKDLTELEKVKSFLMYRSYLSANKKASDIIDRIYDRFGEIYYVLERIKPLFSKRGIIEVGEDQICQYDFIGENDWENKYEYQNFLSTIKNKLNRLWYNGKHKDILNFIDSYTNTLKESFIAFEAILNYENKNLDSIIYIGKIAIFFPLLIQCYKTDKSKDKIDFNRILEVLEKFSTRMYAINSYRRKDLTYIFNVLTYNFELEKNFKDLEVEILSYIKEYCSPLESTLKSPDLYNLIASRNLNYLFWKYENYLRNTFQPKSNEMSYNEFNDKSGKYRITIDHITAQTPLNGLKFEERTEDFENEYLNSLGNLTISPQSSNSSMGNQLWYKKNKTYFEKAPFKTQLELSSFIKPNKKIWGKRAIRLRTKKIVSFAIKKWGTNE